jgi:uncharacterized membrane protein YphA (DoxX/SURF4 family)
MKKMLRMVMSHSGVSHELGHTLIRIALGTIFLIFGYCKLMAGTGYLAQIGSAMGAFGITHGYALWGMLAALTECVGGIAYILGFLTRIVSVPLIGLLIVAMKYHMLKGDPFTVWAFPLICLCIVIGCLIAGSGKYSLDYMILRMQD